jgi:hypothetical protein
MIDEEKVVINQDWGFLKQGVDGNQRSLLSVRMMSYSVNPLQFAKFRQKNSKRRSGMQPTC